jgi:hypothetical protein
MRYLFLESMAHSVFDSLPSVALTIGFLFSFHFNLPVCSLGFALRLLGNWQRLAFL